VAGGGAGVSYRQPDEMTALKARVAVLEELLGENLANPVRVSRSDRAERFHEAALELEEKAARQMRQGSAGAAHITLKQSRAAFRTARRIDSPWWRFW